MAVSSGRVVSSSLLKAPGISAWSQAIRGLARLAPCARRVPKAVEMLFRGIETRALGNVFTSVVQETVVEMAFSATGRRGHSSAPSGACAEYPLPLSRMEHGDRSVSG
jgi:hypothetical protein